MSDIITSQNQPKPPEKSYLPFISDFKDPQTKELKGHNFMGFPKSWFLFKSRVYTDLAIPQNDRTQSAKDYNFILFPEQSVVIGIPSFSIKQNKQMPEAVNFYLKKDENLPVIQFDKIATVSSESLLKEIEEAMVKTKEFYAKNPPIANQNPNVKVFETTINKISQDQFMVDNLTTKFMDGQFELDGKKYALIHFPFNTTTRIIVPAENVKDHENGSFSVMFSQKEYKTVPCYNLPLCNAYNFYQNTKKILKVYNKEHSKPKTPNLTH